MTVDPRMFNEKERHGIGRCRVVVAMSHWARGLSLDRRVPIDCKRKVEWEWIDEPKLTSGVFAILWAAKQGCKQIYTVGVDLTPGYNRSLDENRYLLVRAIENLQRSGVEVYKRSAGSSLPVPIKEPPLSQGHPEMPMDSPVIKIMGRRSAPWQKRTEEDRLNLPIRSSMRVRRPFI